MESKIRNTCSMGAILLVLSGSAFSQKAQVEPWLNKYGYQSKGQPESQTQRQAQPAQQAIPALTPAEVRFERDVLKARNPVIVIFEVSWCPHCQNLARIVSQLKGVPYSVIRIDIEKPENKVLVKKWKKTDKYPELQSYWRGARLDSMTLAGDPGDEGFPKYVENMMTTIRIIEKK